MYQFVPFEKRRGRLVIGCNRNPGSASGASTPGWGGGGPLPARTGRRSVSDEFPDSSHRTGLRLRAVIAHELPDLGFSPQSLDSPRLEPLPPVNLRLGCPSSTWSFRTAPQYVLMLRPHNNDDQQWW